MIKTIEKWSERRAWVKSRNLRHIVTHLISVFYLLYMYSFPLLRSRGKGYVIRVIFVELLAGTGSRKHRVINRLKTQLLNHRNSQSEWIIFKLTHQYKSKTQNVYWRLVWDMCTKTVKGFFFPQRAWKVYKNCFLCWKSEPSF